MKCTDVPEILSPEWEDYELVDCGGFEKLERFGRYVTVRPEPQAIWHKSLPEEEWERMASAVFRRDANSEERGRWLAGGGNAGAVANRLSLPRHVPADAAGPHFVQACGRIP